MNSEGHWTNLVTVLVQSAWLFILSFLCAAMPHLWNDTYATALKGQALPALTQWFHDTMPQEMSGMMCLSLLISVTHACLGFMLVFTASSSVNATQRVLLVNTVGWGIILFWLGTILIAQALPFITTLRRLLSDEEMRQRAIHSRMWIAITATYCTALILSTTWVCRKKRNVEPVAGYGS